MAIEKIISGDGLELVMSGRVDGAMANELEIEILAALRQGAKNLYINLSQSDFLCSAGIRVLLQYWRRMKSEGKSLYVAKPSPEVDAVLKTTGFRDLIVEGARPS